VNVIDDSLNPIDSRQSVTHTFTFHAHSASAPDIVTTCYTHTAITVPVHTYSPYHSVHIHIADYKKHSCCWESQRLWIYV